MFPSLFISHGSPMLALQPGASGPALQRLAAEMPRPKAIVVVSAHWESHDLLVSGSAAPETWHDFGGFPRELFAVQYPAPGNPQLAGEIVGLLRADWLGIVGMTAGLSALTVVLEDGQRERWFESSMIVVVLSMYTPHTCPPGRLCYCRNQKHTDRH